MPSASRRKAKQIKTIKALITHNHHSQPSVQLQGLALSANHSKMEGSFNGTLEDTLKVESLNEDKKVVLEDAVDGTSKSHSETPDVDVVITDKEAVQSEENRELVESDNMQETENVSESVADNFEPNVSSSDDLGVAIEAALVDNKMASDTVELELKEEEGKDFLGFSQVVDNHEVKETELPLSEENNDFSSVSANEGLKETEVVETIKDMTVAEEEKNVLSSVVTDGLLGEGEEPNEINYSSSLPPTDYVVSKDSLETSNPKSDESDKVPPTITGEVPEGIARSLDDKVWEQSYVQDSAFGSAKESFQESSNESAKESFHSSANHPDAESTITTVQDKTEEPRTTENPTIVSVTQRQHTSWKSCCGLFEILSRGD